MTPSPNELPVGATDGTAGPPVGPATTWLPLAAVAAWCLGAFVATRAGLWMGLGCTAVVLGTLVSAREWAYLRHLLRPRPRSIVMGLVVGAAMTLATNVLYLPVSVALPLVATDVASLYGKLGADTPLGVALALIPVIIGEEIVWRGLVYGAVARRMRLSAAVALTAALYALAHAPVGSPVLVAAALSCGLVWGALRAATGGLVAPVAAHLLWDTMVLFVWPPFTAPG